MRPMFLQGSLPPDLTNQANLAQQDKPGAVNSAPAGGELKPSLLDEMTQGVAEMNPLSLDDPGKSAANHSSRQTSAFAAITSVFQDAQPTPVLKKSLSATDPGAFLSPKVSGESFEARHSTEGRDSLI